MKRKGFTLIELLAVIVILAVIALIATPLIMNVINDAKKNSFKDSAYGIIKAVEMKVAAEQINRIDGQNIGYKVNVKENGINYEGDRPEAGWASVDVDGEVTLYMTKGDWCAYKDDTTNEQVVITTTVSDCDAMSTIENDHTLATLTENGVEIPTAYTYIKNTDENETYKGILYLDPTNLNATCTPELAEANKQGIGYYDCQYDRTVKEYICSNWEYTSTETSTGCMKWFAFGDDGNGNPTTAILDHNTTARAAYDFQRLSEEQGRVEDMYEATWYFSQSTNNWDEVLEARFPTSNEIKEETGSPNFHSYLGGSTETRGNYWWFYTNLITSETNAGRGTDRHYYLAYEDMNGTQKRYYTGGYWTGSSYGSSMYYIATNGRMLGNVTTDNTNYGVRPVISLSALELTD